MKKLTKKDRRHFESVCQKIREELHLEHWENRYDFEQKDSEEMYAEHRSYVNGRRLWIGIYPKFWTATPEVQLSTLIHEHIHAMMQQHDQAIYKIIDWSHDSDSRWSNVLWKNNLEVFVDHLTSVLYDLLKDRF